MEVYTKAIYAIESHSDGRVSTSALADRLFHAGKPRRAQSDRSRGVQGRDAHGGGELVALEIIRHHRLLEAFPTDELDYDWTDVHDVQDVNGRVDLLRQFDTPFNRRHT